ncbi:MAG: hypothetical protein J6Y55_07300 [Bacteroidales bacterium]|nr:hypothetical protein [Bacteroidales bacterium]
MATKKTAKKTSAKTGKSSSASKKSLKKTTKKIRKTLNRGFLIGAATLVVFGIVFGGYRIYSSSAEDLSELGENEVPLVCERVNENYGAEIDSCAKLLGMPPQYLKSLACLECSGRTDVPKRFEKHIYRRLKKVRSGDKPEYEGVTTAMIRDASDEALKNLATSWGPFQIMGYKCLHLNINVADLRGNDAVYWGIKWIRDEYGHLLKKGRYRDAFHYHNTGRIFPADGNPTTYDKNYVPNGLEYMRYF